MSRAAFSKMNYYEQLVAKMNQSMDEHPRSVLVMDMDSLKIVAKGATVQTAARKFHAANLELSRSVIFQKPSTKVTWIL